MKQGLTEDTFCNGQIRVKQHTNGYRFSLDPVLLAWHLSLPEKARLVDLGTGCGIIPLILACRYPALQITGVEIQKELADLARTNVRENRLENRITICCRDLKSIGSTLSGERPDLVVCNPPFRRANSGRLNPHPERAIARHEVKASLKDFTSAAGRLLQTGGEFAAIYPAFRLADMIQTMRESFLEPKRLRMIHSRHNTEAKLLFVEGRKNGRSGLNVLPPLVLYRNNNGEYTPEAEKIFFP